MLETIATLVLALSASAQSAAKPPEAVGAPRRVHLELAESLARNQAPTPDLEVAVVCTPGYAFLGPPVRASLRTVRLDERGHAELDLDVPPEAGRRPWIWAQVVSPGYQQRTNFTALDPDRDRESVFIEAVQGGTLYGTIHPGPGTDEYGGRVRLAPTEPRTPAPPCGRTDADGRFRLHFVERGRYHLQATWKDRGGAVLRDLALDPAGDPASVELTLDTGPAGAGFALSGHVLDPDGEPVYPFVVSAVPEGFEHLPRETVGAEWQDGVYGERTVTDAEGRFTLHGVLPGRSFLIGAFQHFPPEVLSKEPVLAGTASIEVEARVHRVSLRVLDAEENPLVLETRKGDPDPGVLLLQPRGQPQEIVQAPFRIGSEALRAAEPGSELLAAFTSPSTPLIERTLLVPDRPWLVRETLQLPPPVAPARLRVSVRNGEEPFRESTELTVQSLTGLDALRPETFPDGERTVEVAPGRYRVRVRPTHWLFCWGGDPEELVPDYAWAEAEVELVAGQEHELTLCVCPNARLRVELALPAQGSDEELEQAMTSSSDWRRDLRPMLGGVPFVLTPEADGAEFSPDFAMEKTGLLREVVAPWIAPGRPCTSISAIPPGRYRARIELADGRRLQQPVELIAGETTSLTFTP